MNPQEQFCHNPACWAYGRVGEGHIRMHSRRERRYQCKRCARTFAATRGTAVYRAHKGHEAVVRLLLEEGADGNTRECICLSLVNEFEKNKNVYT